MLVGPHVTSGHTVYSVLTTQAAYSLDTKFDDGWPGQGNVRGVSSDFRFSTVCSTTADPTTSEYRLDLTDKTAQCILG